MTKKINTLESDNMVQNVILNINEVIDLSNNIIDLESGKSGCLNRKILKKIYNEDNVTEYFDTLKRKLSGNHLEAVDRIRIEKKIEDIRVNIISQLDSFDYDEGDEILNIPQKRGVVNYKQIENCVDELYYTNQEYYSSAMDIVASYLKGQKLIYMASKSYCENKLNWLMTPAIFLSSAAAVISTVSQNNWYENFILACINAIISFLLAIINYKKLDAKSEAHKTSAHAYDKLQAGVEFKSGEFLLIHHDEKKYRDEIEKKLTDVNLKITEIKATNQFIIPTAIRNAYSFTYNVNVFSIIKKILNLRYEKITQLKNVINRISDLKKDIQRDNRVEEIRIRKMKIKYAYKVKNQTITSILLLKSGTSLIDDCFRKETEYQYRRQEMVCNCFKDKYVSPLKESPNIVKMILEPFQGHDMEELNLHSIEKNDHRYSFSKINRVKPRSESWYRKLTSRKETKNNVKFEIQNTD